MNTKIFKYLLPIVALPCIFLTITSCKQKQAPFTPVETPLIIENCYGNMFINFPIYKNELFTLSHSDLPGLMKNIFSNQDKARIDFAWNAKFIFEYQLSILDRAIFENNNYTLLTVAQTRYQNGIGEVIGQSSLQPNSPIEVDLEGDSMYIQKMIWNFHYSVSTIYKTVAFPPAGFCGLNYKAIDDSVFTIYTSENSDDTFDNWTSDIWDPEMSEMYSHYLLEFNGFSD